MNAERQATNTGQSEIQARIHALSGDNSFEAWCIQDETGTTVALVEARREGPLNRFSVQRRFETLWSRVEFPPGDSLSSHSLEELTQMLLEWNDTTLRGDINMPDEVSLARERLTYAGQELDRVVKNRNDRFQTLLTSHLSTLPNSRAN